MLISFEGLPGAGKSTQAALLTTCLTQRGLPAVTLPDLATLDTEPVAATLIDLFASSGDPYRRHGNAITETLLAAAIRADILATVALLLKKASRGCCIRAPCDVPCGCARPADGFAHRLCAGAGESLPGLAVAARR